MSNVTNIVHYKANFADDLKTVLYRDLMESFIQSCQSSPDWRGEKETWPLSWSVDQEMERMQHTLKMSESFFIAKNMSQLAMVAAKTLPDDDSLELHDIPAHAGFMWLDQPFRVIDIRRKLLVMNAIMWTASSTRVRLWCLTSKWDREDSVNQTLRSRWGDQYQLAPELMVAHVYEIKFGEHIPKGYSWDTPLPWDAQVYLDETVNEDGSTSITMMTDHTIDITKPPEIVPSPLAAYIITVWRLCMATLPTREEYQPNRHERKRLWRANLPEKKISVIVLRRKSHGTGDAHTEIEWTHQWIVRAHYRRQPYKDEGVLKYKTILILPYIKGPEGAPLLIRERINYLKR